MPPDPTFSRSRELMATPLDALRGVGPKVLEKLHRMGLSTVEDALYCLPLRYEDRRRITPIGELRSGNVGLFQGEILASGEKSTSRSRRRLFEAVVSDGTGQVCLKWFRYKSGWMKNRFAKGKKAVFIGEVKNFSRQREVHHPEVEFLDNETSFEDLSSKDSLSYGRVLPVYPLTEGLNQKAARKIWYDLVGRFSPVALSVIPETILRRHHLIPLPSAFKQAHWPDDDSSIKKLEDGIDAGRRTLVFDEFFFLELGLALKRKGISLEEGIAFKVNHLYTKPLAKMLPYRLTGAQRRVLGEIKEDMMAAHPMHRLVQGDVGSGKTIVALMAALVAIENETQVAVVAPTEILAEQHYLQFHSWIEALGLKVVFLSSSLTASAKKEVLEGLKDGSIHMVVGTHAVLQQGVEFKRLGLGIVDEQHRFGVKQRGVLKKMGDNPDILVMTATPIPRTLSLTLFGDLSISVIDELPPGRTPVKTRIVTEANRHKAYSLIGKELEEGRQAYIVYPLVEESEKSDLKSAVEGAEFLQNEVFSRYRVAILHGQMKAEEKEATMQAFKAREVDILAATTVIEVGIDVPNASVMMIEHAERFGLAQLHQLRGRVGRGAAKSFCLLARSHRCSEDGMRRLQVMEDTTDGFKIAEADLEIRGPGEFLGTRQSGLPDFKVANIIRDSELLQKAREEAFALAADPDFMTDEKYAEIRETLMFRWGSRLELATIG